MISTLGVGYLACRRGANFGLQTNCVRLTGLRPDGWRGVAAGDSYCVTYALGRVGSMYLFQQRPAGKPTSPEGKNSKPLQTRLEQHSAEPR